MYIHLVCQHSIWQEGYKGVSHWYGQHSQRDPRFLNQPNQATNWDCRMWALLTRPPGWVALTLRWRANSSHENQEMMVVMKKRSKHKSPHISTLFFFKVAMPSIKVWQKNAELIRWIQRKRTAFLTIQSHYWYLAMPVNQWGDCLEFSCQSCFRCPSQMNLLECPSHNSPPRIFLQTNILVSMPFSPTAFSPFLHLTAWKSHVHARSPGPVLALFPGPPVWCICLDVGLSIMIKWPFAREACSNAAGAVLSSACKRCCVKSAVNIGWSWSS